MKTVAVIQSNYLPWRGYFDIIHDVDLFIFYDEVQYTKNDWRNRNRIYSKQGLSWLTLPCGYNLNQSILETTLKNELDWGKQHWNKLSNAYRKAPYFGEYHDFFQAAYLDMEWTHLYQLNHFFIQRIAADFLGIHTPFADSRDFPSEGSRGDKLLSLLKAAGATRYISGPAAKNYLDEAAYAAAGIEVIWKDYSGYPQYPQQNSPFEGTVSIVDLLFNVGPKAPHYIWGWRENQPA